jgi:Nuclease-related domain
VRDWLYPFYCGAGRGARAKYREVHGHWRKRVFRRPRLIYVVLAAPIVILGRVEHYNVWLWSLGVGLNLLLGAYMAIIESPPTHIENWRAGFEGERLTARTLAPLRRCGWVLLHDLQDRRAEEQNGKANIDHVVVSPRGVFLLDSKRLGGAVSIDRDTVHLQRLDDDDDFYDDRKLARKVRGCAVRLQEDIEQRTGVRWVQPVVVFWNDFDAGLVNGQNVIFVHGERLVDWLGEQTPQMAPDTVARVADGIEAARPGKHRAWWDRLPTFGLRGQGALVVPPNAGGAARES